MRATRTLSVLAAMAVLYTAAPGPTPAYGNREEHRAWTAAVNAESVPGTSTELNTPHLDGCPIQSPDGTSLYLASNRPGGLGGIDIWVAHRPSVHHPWGPPRNLGAPVNSEADDFCPTPTDGRLFFFVSTRPGGCGAHPAGDIYLARRTDSGFGRPRNLGCHVNSPAGEASPSYVREGGEWVLYFSSNRGDQPPFDADIWRSVRGADGAFGPPTPVTEVNTGFEDARPNVRRDGLVMVFDSTRPGTLGGHDIHVSTRRSTGEPWGAPYNLGPSVNTSASETRASLDRTGNTLVFGSDRPGSETLPGSTNPSNDIYVSTRGRCG